MTADAEQSHIGLVVEGRGDRAAVPILFRRYLESRGEYRDVLGRAIPCNGRDKALTDGGLEGYVAAAASRPGCVGVLVVLDGEGDAVCSLGPELRDRAQAVTEKPVLTCLAEACFEDWLDAAFESLDLGDRPASTSGQTAIKKALYPRSYVKPTWQPRLAARLDIQLAASRSASLSRALQRLDELCDLIV